MECNIVIFLPLAGGCPETEETTMVSGVYCYVMGVPHVVMGGVQYRKTEEGSNINSSITYIAILNLAIINHTLL